MITQFSSFPDPAALQRNLDAFARATDKIAAERDHMNFGKRIAQAVQRKTSAHLPTQKQHKERVERERSRYPQPRKRTKGE